MREALRSMPLFHALSDEELLKIEAIVQEVQFPAETTLFEYGQPSDSFFLVVSGKVKIRIPAAGAGDERILYLGKGRFFGEMGVIRNTPRSADAIVQEDAELLRISQEDFDGLMAVDDGISGKIMAAYHGRMNELREEREGGRTLDTEHPKAIAVWGVGGGAGASFTTANLAVKLAQITQKTVLVVDLDLEGASQHLYLGAKGHLGGLSSVFSASQITTGAIRGSARKTEGGVELLGGPGMPSADKVPAEIIPEFLRNALRSYYYVLIDLPSAGTGYRKAVLESCDVNYLVVGSDPISQERARAKIELLEGLGLKERTRVVLNKVRKGQTNLKEEVQNSLSTPILGELVLEEASCFQALNARVPVVVQAPTSAVSSEMTRLTRQAVSLPASSPPSRGFSLWGLLSRD